MRELVIRSRVLAAVGFSVLMGFCSPADAQVMVDGYWRLTEDDPGAVAGAAGNSVTLDRSGNNRSLTLVGVPAYSSAGAPVGPGSCGSMSFAGNSRYVGPAVTSATDNFGIEAWVRPAALSAQMIAYIGHSGGNGFGRAVRQIRGDSLCRSE